MQGPAPLCACGLRQWVTEGAKNSRKVQWNLRLEKSTQSAGISALDAVPNVVPKQTAENLG